MTKKLYNIFWLAIIGLFISSCNKYDEPTVITIEKCKRTVLVYMVASNSLGTNNFDYADIAEMKDAMSNYTAGECRLLIYHTRYNSAPKLVEIKNNGTSFSTDTLKTYSSTTQASVTKSRIAEVLNDMTTYAPANDYGLVLWSHATGWVRSLTRSASIRDFGEDSGATMPIDSLADALPDNMFSFIYADACFMGSIEVAYQLRNKTNYFIGSPIETPAYGMPYDTNIPCFFENEPNLTGACENTYNYYANFNETSNETTNKAYRSMCISLIDCTKLEDVANACRSIYATAKELSSTDDLQCYNISQPYIYYDFKQYTDSISTDETLTAQFNTALDNAVLYKASTPILYLILVVDSEKYSGLSTYILGTGSSTNEEYYKTLDWYNDVIKQ